MGIEYPQRWLREAQAVTSTEGWRQSTTNELLKCQKGLDVTPPAVKPTNTVAPVLSGTTEVNGVLSVTQGTWSGTNPITYAYRWKTSTNGTSFTNTQVTTQTYTVVAGDVDKYVAVDITATNSAGSTTVTSNVSSKVAAEPVT